MRRFIPIVLVLTWLGSLAGCAFPPEPPEKLPGSDQPDVPEIDKASALLPLKPGNWWVYVVEGGGPPQGPRLVVSKQIAYEGQIYYQLRYFLDRGPIVHEAFPLFVQNTGSGLKFFLVQDTINIERAPRYAFTLPYPARAGLVTEEPTSGYRVAVVSKDTLVQGKPIGATYRCYRYDISLNQKHRHSFYVVPGSALVIVESTIEQERYRFLTFGWFLQ